MKTERVIRLFLAVLVLFFVAAGQAAGAWWWPPDNVEIVPENPTSADVVDITFSGNWPDSCIPSSFPIEVTGNDIYFNVISDTNNVCTQVPTPWQETRSVGPLSPGTYRVYASLDRGPWTSVTEFYVAETNTYVFVPDQSIVVQTGGFAGVHITYSIEGQFQLTVDFDANTASFDGVDANLSNGVDLDDLFDMTELVGTVVSDTQIEFDTPEPLPGGKVVHIDVTLVDDSIQMTGGFCQPWLDGFCFQLDGVARKKHTAGEVSWIPGESSPAAWKIDPDTPSTSDMIYFSGPTAIFGNSCSAEASMGGTPTLTIDPVNKTVELWFQPPPPDICPNVWDPVCGLKGSLGPLEAGQWTFFGSHPEASFSITFQVGNSNSVINDGIKYYMQTDKSVYQSGEEVEMLYRVTNLTANPVDIGYILSCEDAWTHFMVTDDDGSDIWQFFRINPPCGHIMFSLAPYESRECQRVWDMTNDNGTLEPDDDFPVGPGLYNIAGELELDGSYERVPVSVTIEIIPFVYYVDADATGANDGSSWADAYTSLPYALDCASSGDDIRVAQGTYRPNDGIVHIPEFDNRKLTFQLKNGVTVKGGYAGYGEANPDARDIQAYEAILSGDLYGNDVGGLEPNDPSRDENSYHVVTSSGNDASAVLDGVTITGGNANADGPLDEHGDRGGGMYVNRGSPTLRDCTFAGNSAHTGGGMFIWAADPKVTGCTFRANAAERHAGGLAVAEPYLKSVTNCTFSANFAGGSGGAVWNFEAAPTYVNCLFTGNRAGENGGAMRNSDSGGYTLVNCTLSDNVAGQRGGAIDSDEWPILVNCIFWANRDSSGMGESAHVRGHYQQPSFNYCCVQGWTGALGGNGNIGADPEFADANGDDYHVAAGSPCIDAGDNSAVPPSLLTDLDGNPRIVNGTVDMGAYEFQGIIYVDDDAPNDPGPGDPEVSDPAEDGSEAHPFDTIQEAIDVAKDGYTVFVAGGGYLKSKPGDPWDRSGKVMFDGKNIKLTSADPTDAGIVKNTVIRGIVEFDGTENANCILTGFAVSDLATGSIYGNRTHATISHCIISGNGPCSATVIKDCDGTISNCLITDNATIALCGVDPVILGCHGLIKYCTIANNYSGIGVLAGGTTTLENCIIYYNYEGFSPAIAVGGSGGTLNISYCDLQGGLAGISIEGEVNWGPGNINIDPCFVQIGSHWDEPYLEGDYHLKSEGWRWDDEAGRWTYDYVTSRCIDAGNPGSPLGDELLRVLPADPNNDYGVNVRINMGAYGGTAEASMAPPGWSLLADLDNNGIVDWLDLGEQAEDWLESASEQPGDLNRDGVVNMKDYAILAQNWSLKTSWYKPPIVLEVYSCYYPKLLLDKITMAGEGEITISVEGASRYSIYALREGYYTELYYCQKGETIDVDLDMIIPDKFNGVIFMSDVFVEDCYLENTNVKVMDNDTVITVFQTDEQGRFAMELEPGNYYFEFAWFGWTFLEKVEIRGEYQDFVFPCDIGVDKPNIYLYPEETIELDVDIVFPHGGRVTNSIPDYGDGWHITVEPSGVINGEYSCLFYEASVPDWGQYAVGWVVGREDLEEFFTDNMTRTGFNQKEIADFVEYWIPRLVDYPYYAIYPQYNGELEETIRLEFSVQPANIIRLIYSVRGLENSNFELPEPVVPAYSREGFTVAEWGIIQK